jgi:hypothetical protein
MSTLRTWCAATASPAALVHLHGRTGPVYDPPALATVADARAAAGGRAAQASSQLLGRGAPHRYQGLLTCGRGPGRVSVSLLLV